MTPHVVQTLATAVLMALALLFSNMSGVHLGVEVGWERPPKWADLDTTRGYFALLFFAILCAGIALVVSAL